LIAASRRVSKNIRTGAVIKAKQESRAIAKMTARCALL